MYRNTWQTNSNNQVQDLTKTLLKAKNCHTEEKKERAGRQNFFCRISKYSK